MFPELTSTRPLEDPVSPTIDWFATARPQHVLPVSSALPSALRPFGLRFLNALGATNDVAPPEYRYDETRQLALGVDDRPLYLSERRPRSTTGSSDGGSGPMEEWTYD